MLRLVPPALLAIVLSACAALGQLSGLVQAPRFDEAPDRQSEIRLLGPAVGRPLGGASVRLWAEVTNPNPFGFTLSHVSGQIFLEEASASTVELPLGLPLPAGDNAVFPIDVNVSFAELPRLGDVIRRAIGRQPIAYRFEGTVGIDAGRYGTPRFGPMTLLEGTVQ